MNFRTVKAAIASTLNSSAAGRFRVIGYQQQAKGASEYVDDNRSVQVFYSSGDFSKRGSALNGPVQHDTTFRLELTVAKAAEGDIETAAGDRGSNQVATAIANFLTACQVADESFDELVDIVFNIVMDARNIDFGLTTGTVTNRFVTSVEKDEPLERGEYAVLTGTMTLTLRTVEEITGDTGTPADSIAVTIDLEDDDVERTGVEVATT